MACKLVWKSRSTSHIPRAASCPRTANVAETIYQASTIALVFMNSRNEDEDLIREESSGVDQRKSESDTAEQHPAERDEADETPQHYGC